MQHPLDETYTHNTAKIIGYYLGSTRVAIGELESPLIDTERAKFIANQLRGVIALCEKWWEVRYEGRFGADEITEMLRLERKLAAEKKSSDIVELERA